MSQKDAKPNYKEIVLKQLRQPLKLRVLLCLVIIALWYSLFFSPLSQDTTAATARISRERARVATARQIDQLKKSIVPYQGRVLVGSDINELMRYVIAQMRTSPLKLLDLKPEKPKDHGPIEGLGLKLTLEGRYTEIDEFLKWVETDERLLRIDAIRLDPLAKDPSRLTAQVLLLILAEKPPPPTLKAKSESDKKS
jgi:Tfp pilus assembly protein PilO